MASADKQVIEAEEVPVSDLPDIAAEQAKLAAGINTEGATPSAEVFKEEGDEKVDEPYVAPKEKTLDDGDEDLLAKFAEAKGKPIAATAKKAAEVPTVAPKIIGATDHTDVDEELRPLFKQMSNPAIEKIKPLLIESKKIKEQNAQLQTELENAKKNGLPDNYYEHEMSYVLTPTFSEVSQRVNSALAVYNHWRHQLSQLRNGAETYVPLVDDGRGGISTSQAVKADRGTIDEVEDIRSFAMNQYNDEKRKLDSLAENHRSKYTEAKNWITTFQAKAFPAIESNDNLKAVVKDLIKNFPAVHQSNPLANSLARALYTITELGKQITQQKAGEVAPAVKKKQPSAAIIAGGGSSSNGKASINNDDNLVEAFAKAKRGEL